MTIPNHCETGDCREVMRRWIGEGVKGQMCVTSPPYWGLRSYLDDQHEHKSLELGSEAALDEYIANMVEVFGLVRELLADDGTCWINLGDSYATGTAGARTVTAAGKHGYWENPAIKHRINGAGDGLKPKDLCGVPWRLAFALQAAGWYLRQDIIWSKLNPMPESVTDRCTKSHEYLFLLSKRERYFYDAEAIKEPASYNTHARVARATGDHKPRIMPKVAGHAHGPGSHSTIEHNRPAPPERKDGPGVTPKSAPSGSGIKANESFHATNTAVLDTRNKRSVWTFASEPYPEAHFATFPQALVEPCILAGSRAGDLVCDPFAGAGTTLLVAKRLGRNYLGCELNSDYVEMAQRRLDAISGCLFSVTETVQSS